MNNEMTKCPMPNCQCRRMHADGTCDTWCEAGKAVYVMMPILDLINGLGLSMDDLTAIENPPWNEWNKIHNWRNYVPDYVQKNWNTMCMETKLVVFAMTSKLANDEEWD